MLMIGSTYGFLVVLNNAGSFGVAVILRPFTVVLNGAAFSGPFIMPPMPPPSSTSSDGVVKSASGVGAAGVGGFGAFDLFSKISRREALSEKDGFVGTVANVLETHLLRDAARCPVTNAGMALMCDLTPIFPTP
mmetsp:Transcript_21003/g.37948  ORF Transcript_21003/g.37948 Transcript_21003/m.37948 type:complete len:134 (+) Transcript_21003:460-861(+)